MRALAWFWAAILVLVAGGAGFLQWHGPTKRPVAHAAPPVAEAKPSTMAFRPIPPADPALLEPSQDFAGGFLPRLGADHRTPSEVYAAVAPAGERRPMVAVLLAGIGMSATDSDLAIIATPAPIAMAVSPYTVQPDGLLAEARQHGHELFVSIPMEPRNFPLDDAGNRALLTGNPPALNQQMLFWAMTRFGGYVGATAALGPLHGERFLDSPAQLGPVLDELTNRGLLYVDPRPDATLPDQLAGRRVDVLIDQIPGAAEIEANLTRLEQIALARGSALGLVSVPRPVAIARLVAWAASLPERGVVLMPVSAVVRTQPHPQQAGP